MHPGGKAVRNPDPPEPGSLAVTNELERAIQLREEGGLEEARGILLELLEKRPDDSTVNYQCAWVNDLMGREREAIPLYERAIANGLPDEDLEGAVLSLSRSHRAVEEHGKAVEVLRDGFRRFPGNRAMQVFLAMALQNVGEHDRAMELLLRNLAETTRDGGISVYERAILFYADRLDETW